LGVIETTTGSINSYTSSTNVRLNSIETSTSSLNTFTSSTNGRLNSVESTTSSLNTFTSSTNTRLGVIESTTGSLNTFTSSANGRLNSLESTTSSLNSFTNSINTTIKNKLNTDGVISGSIQVDITQTTNYTTFSSSISSSIGLLSSSIATTDLGQNNRLNSIEGKTGSYATTGSNNFIGSQIITGSLTITQNLTVLGSSSLLIVTSSQLALSSSTISVNVFEPAERFGGIKVYDSGSESHLATASLLWDSLKNHWIYQNASGSNYSGGMLLSGPRNTGSLGDEIGLTSGRIAKSVGGDHLDNSIMSETNGSIGISGSLVVTGSISASGTVYGTNITAIESTTSSLNSYTASNNTTNTTQNNRLTSLESTTSSLNSYTSSTNTRLGVIESSTSSLNTYTSSNNTRLGVIESTTSSLNTFTSSASVRLNTIESTTGSLNTFTSSTNTRLNNIETSTGSLNSFTSSANGRLNSLESTTSSLNSYTSSNNSTNTTQNNRLTSLESTTSSLNSYTSSNTTNINAIHTATSSLNTFTSSADGRLNSIESKTGSISSLNTYTGSNNTVIGTLQTSTGSLNSYTSSNTTNINAIHTATSSLNSFTSSANGRLNSIESKTGSIASLNTYTGSNNTVIGTLQTSTSSLNSYTSSNTTNINAIHTATSSLNTFTNSFNSAFSLSGADVTVKGNFIVSGTTTTVNSTTVSIGDNIIQLNGSGATNAGIVVRDATSPTTTSGSFLWDTTNDKWIAGPLGSEDDVVLRTATQTLTNKTINASQLVDGSVSNAKLANSSFNIGTTSISLGRASASQTLTGVSIDGNAGTVTNGVYTTGDQTIGGLKTFSSNITNSATADWYMYGFGSRGASSGQYGMGLGSDIANRTLSFHIPNHAAYSSSGVVPKFGWYSNGSVELMTLQSATGNLVVTGTISASNFSGTSSGTNTGDQTNITGNAGTVTNGLYTTSDQTITGQKTFPSAIGNRPILSGGFISAATGDLNVDIWGISEDYYPSHATAANAWGIRWNGDGNDLQFVGGGTNRVVIDLDAGNITSTGTISGTTIYGTWNGTAIANAYLANSSFNIGTTSITLGRASASQTLTGVSIDGNAATVTNGVYTTGTQTIGGAKTFTSPMVIDTTEAWDATNPMLNVGGTGDGRIQVRHIHGKSDSSASADNLWLQYQNPSKHVQIGASGGGNNLYVSGDIYMNGYLAGNKVATESYVTSQGYLTSVTNISGYAGNLYSSDTRTPSPSSHGAYRLNFGFTSFNCNNTSPWADYLHLRSYSDSSGGADNLVVFRKTGGIEMRIYQQSFGSGTAYSDYRRVAMTKATTFSNVSSVTFTHDLLTENLTAQVFDTNGDMFWPTNIRITSTQVILTFSTNRSGRLVVTG
jgi:ABC-type transporter Mla subunit MlaD